MKTNFVKRIQWLFSWLFVLIFVVISVLLLVVSLCLAATKPTSGGTRTLDTSHSLADGLVGAWLFNENSGSTAADSTSNDNDGTLFIEADFRGTKRGTTLNEPEPFIKRRSLGEWIRSKLRKNKG